jgi:hypothetical protein
MLANNLVIIIQGPIITSGNSGSGVYMNKLDCTDNIKHLISSSKHLAKGFILSTWQTEIPILLDDDVIVLRSNDPGPKPVIGFNSPSNDFRQSFGCIAAINKAIELYNPLYILKIRTDQFLDLPTMINHMVAVNERSDIYKSVGQSGYLFFPNMISWSPYSVGDFYIGGHAKDVQLFFEAQLKLSNHTFGYDFSWLHSDIILRHAYHNLKNSLSLPDFYYFPNITPSFRLQNLLHRYPIKFHSSVLTLWCIILQKSVSFFPRSTHENMLWRGSKMDPLQHCMGEFFEEWEMAHPNFDIWLRNQLPNLYLRDSTLSFLDKFLHFHPEKILEFRYNRSISRRHLYRLIRICISILKGIFPKELIIPLSTIKGYFIRN